MTQRQGKTWAHHVPIPVWIGVSVLRELIRAAVFPLHLLVYWFRHRQRRAEAEAMLTQHAASARAPDSPDSEGFDLTPLEPLFARARGTPEGAPPHLLLSTGETSGELHAVRLVERLRTGSAQQSPRVSAFGGEPLRAALGSIHYPLSEYAIIGVAAVFGALPFILRACAQFLRVLRTDRPDLVVLIDYPGLHLVFARLARLHGVPVLHYIAPQYWAWAPWRLRRYRRSVDACLTILPFEPTFYAESGVPSAYVGHPLVDHLVEHPPSPTATEQVRQRPTVVVLPGSRRREIDLHLPPLIECTRALHAAYPDHRFVVVHTQAKRGEQIRALLDQHGDNASHLELHVGDLAPWLAGARLALAKSGTGSLETCLHGAITVVFYRLDSRILGWLQDSFLTVPFVSATNLIAGRQIVPEFVAADDSIWPQVEQAAHHLLATGEDRATAEADLAEVREALGTGGATDRVAQVIERFFARAPVA